MEAQELAFEGAIPVYRDLLIFPLYFAAISCILLLVQVSLHLRRTVPTRGPRHAAHDDFGPMAELAAQAKELGLATLFAKFLRLLCCLILLCISIVAFVLPADHDQSLNGRYLWNMGFGWGPRRGRYGRKKPRRHLVISHGEWIELSQCAFYAYCSLLAALSFVTARPFRTIAMHHLVAILFAAFCIYVYRDLWPLATFTSSPQDTGNFVWSRIGLLGFVSFVLPSITPREYVPVDPRHPATPTPEQTASLFNFFTYAFLDPVIRLAGKHSHITSDALPPLGDRDRSAYLRKSSFETLDPMRAVSTQHIFWRLLRIFRYEFLRDAITTVVYVFAEFGSPLGVNRLLTYIEGGGEGAVVRPGVWISLLFFGPLIASIGFQYRIFLVNRINVRLEGILTQLIFEHALRIRATDDISVKRSQDSISTSVSNVKPSDNEIPPQSDLAPKRPSTTKPSNGTESGNLTGKITNLMSTDIANITGGLNFCSVMIYFPLQLGLCVMFLYTILGWSAFVGLAFMLLMFPLPGKVAQIINTVQKQQAKKTDDRVQAITENMNVLRMIKLFGWETRIGKLIAEKRDAELHWIKKTRFLTLTNMIINYFLPLSTMMVTFASYTLLMGGSLQASKVFSAITIFGALKGNLQFFLMDVPQFIKPKVSLDRLQDFLKNTELLDNFNKGQNESNPNLSVPIGHRQDIGFHNSVFAWSKAQANSSVASNMRRSFRLRVDGDLFFHRNKVNLIVGPTGSGKTSLLLALLGELHFCPPGLDSWFNLPREGGVAFAAQEPWITNETIRDNILLGRTFNETRYKKVIYQCALERDLALFEAGDRTEVGEKGLTLSGGQKARLSLARAIYSPAAIILLDDVLSALDVHTAQWVVDKCFSGDLIQGRTLILVTHNVAMTSRIADFVVSIGSNGRITSQGTIFEALDTNQALRAEAVEEQVADEDQQNIIDPKEDGRGLPERAGRLTSAEEIKKGHVGWAALRMYFASLGGPVFWTVFLGSLCVSELVNVFQVWFLGHWARQYDLHPPSEVYVPWYLVVYSSITLAGTALYAVGFVAFVLGSMRASRQIHERLAKSMLGATLRFLDSTPLGRILNRFVQDMRAVDQSVSSTFKGLVEKTITIAFKFATVTYLTPVFLLPGIIFASIGGWLGNIYIRAQLPTKREMSNTRSPVFSHFGASIGGLVSLRAYSVEKTSIHELQRRIDTYALFARTFWNLNRWINIRINTLGGLFSAGLATYLFYTHRSHTASNVGFQLNLAVSFTGQLLWWVRGLNDFEVQGNSLERLQEYIAAEQEPAATKSGAPPAHWPSSGSLSIQNLSTRYSKDGPDVLHNVTVEIESGQKIGVVGRTGSGKSSLTLSLLRMIPTSGTVLFDGIPTSSINLESLRSSITIIPQQPELLSGTIRENLDPFAEHSDAILNDALRSVGLFSLQKQSAKTDQITLDTVVSRGGMNYSLGQRQIIALARALVRRSKVLILDEATASLDYETDRLVQQSLSTEFADCTVITVAHRLHTIMDSDKILVLDAGRVVEFDTPSRLLQRKGGAFKTLIDNSGDKELLYAAVH